MKSSDKNLSHRMFSHVYVEEDAKNHPLAVTVLNKLKNSVVIEIKHYKDIFNRPNQDFYAQKMSPKLILAVKREGFLYEGPSICQNYGHPCFFYSSMLQNCMYDCSYCFLQGMYATSNILLFVNTNDFFEEIENKLGDQPTYLTVSYDSDMLAMENLFGLCREWIGFAKKNPAFLVEIRTKSANYSLLSNLQPVENIILAWTITPTEVIDQYERYTPSLLDRVGAIDRAIEDGWKVRICMDPLILSDDFSERYARCLDVLRNKVKHPEKIMDFGIGTFRMPSDYLKKIRKKHVATDLLLYPYENRQGVCYYPIGVENEMIESIKHEIKLRFGDGRVYL